MKKIVALLLSIMMLALAAAPALADEPYEVSIQFVGLFEENRNIANVEAALHGGYRARVHRQSAFHHLSGRCRR